MNGVSSQPAQAGADGMSEDTAVGRRWDKGVALAISQVASPPVLLAAAMAVRAAVTRDTVAWFWAAVYVCCAVPVPVIYLLRQIHHETVADLEIGRREERLRPQLVMAAFLGIAWIALLAGSAPAPMSNLAGILWIQAALILVVTIFWKISVHCATAAVVGMLTWSLFDAALPALLGVTVMAWSRWRLGRHTLAQTVGGILLGIAVFMLAFRATPAL
jgi:membrane-associated phospholipid phosphatase